MLTRLRVPEDEPPNVRRLSCTRAFPEYRPRPPHRSESAFLVLSLPVVALLSLFSARVFVAVIGSKRPTSTIAVVASRRITGPMPDPRVPTEAPQLVHTAT